eukprot:1940059-Rhodomonas_salina.1
MNVLPMDRGRKAKEGCNRNKMNTAAGGVHHLFDTACQRLAEPYRQRCRSLPAVPGSDAQQEILAKSR